ncbi:hypothetical protein [Sediminispirochaeta smaragdinae]|uniref:Lipoprotein n=1 Tax=Sediminispirochaeta smaragdinae (strain DSM 11293 / JCM 15392 / SEBR 4228) TaxID=573413 RepID=E1R825_SEDSS|nr:hypothetical protein [Sediminispirochaeta smaragdinae]ADK82880.1 hypothetical protein Spirs_3794 [Sediminispirochaeta smaragdinae DSM 11293]
MKLHRYLVPLLASLLILFFSGCYSEATTSDGSVSLTVSSKGDIGDSGSGNYLVAKFYDADVMDELETNETITVDEPSGIIIYTPASFPTPSLRYADYIENFSMGSSGSFTVPFLTPKSYRLLLEEYEYSEGDGVSGPWYAGLSNAFTVNAGETSSVSVELLYIC